jgi:hypothetical protein
MANYGANNSPVSGQQALTTTFKTLVVLTAASGTALRRGRMYELDWGQSAAPNATDCDIVYDVSRQTAAGTVTAMTPNPLDPADAAALTVAGVNATVEGTVTANSSVWSKAVNQRNSASWQAAPGGELVWPATNLAGLACRALSPTYVGTTQLNVHFAEQ